MRKYRQDKDYNPEQLKKGTEHELDDKHTKSRVEAERIAKDHLDDDPEYYSKLEKFDLDEKKKRKKAGTEYKRKEGKKGNNSLRQWFKRKGAKGKKGGWVDCNAPDGKGGYKSCGRSDGEKRSKYPACRPTPGACKEKGKGKSWGKKGSKKKRNESMEMTTEQIRKIILEELDNVISERSRKKRKTARKRKKAKSTKKDACYRKVKSRYKVWPSAYASGALTKCRKVGAKNWGNKSKKNESLEEEFKAHDMFDPETGKKTRAKEKEDHHKFAKKGYVHVDPKDIEDILNDEGGAAGLDPFLDELGKDLEDEILKALKGMPDVGKHKSGDYILDDDEEIDVMKEEEEMEEAKKKKPCKPSKGKRFAKRVNGKCRSFGQKGQAKGGGDRIRPGTKKGDAYCARSAKIKKCKNPPCANDLSRKKWKCRGSKSMREEKGE